jgi:SPP1 gp7 family putative phage head morphogenesis protein
MKLSDKKLLDTLVRHQIYLEGVKSGYELKFNIYIEKLLKDVKSLINDIPYDTLDSMTKREMQKLSMSVKRLNLKLFNTYLNQLDKDLKAFMRTDKEVLSNIYVNLLKEDVPETVDQITEATPSESTAMVNDGLDVIQEEDDDSGLWAWLWNGVVPTGSSPEDMLILLTSYSALQLSQLIVRAVSNGYSKKEIIEDLERVISKVSISASSTLRTLIQYLSTGTQVTIEAGLFKRYQWISVIDNRTSEICQSRNLLIFEYGKGPLPPAHNNCRSKIKPVINNTPSQPTSYPTWLKGQPKSVQNYILGPVIGKQFRDGDINNSQLPSFKNAKPLTLEQFSGKLEDMLL